jgi:O-antigen/teichoic acid export membrane protein
MVVPVFIQAASGVPDALFRKHIQFGKMFISETGSFTVATIAAIIAATFHVGVWSFAIRLLGTPALMGLSIALLAGWRPKLTFHFEALRSFANFGAFYFLTAFVGFASLQLDVPIVHKLIGKEQAGIFFLARGLALNTVRQMVAAVSRVMFPVFSLIQHDQSNMRSAFLTGTRCLALLVFPAMAALMVIAPELFRVFLDEEFAPGIRLVQIMALQIAPLCLNNPAAQVLYARGRTRLQFGYSVVISSLEIAAMIVGCRYGIIGVAVLWTAVRIIASPFVLWLASREVDLRLTAALSNASRPLAAAILAGASAWGAAELSRRAGVESSVAILMIKLFTGGAAYSAAALVLERETVSRLLTLLGLSGHMPAFLQPRGARK